MVPRSLAHVADVKTSARSGHHQGLGISEEVKFFIAPDCEQTGLVWMGRGTFLLLARVQDSNPKQEVICKLGKDQDHQGLVQRLKKVSKVMVLNHAENTVGVWEGAGGWKRAEYGVVPQQKQVTLWLSKPMSCLQWPLGRYVCARGCVCSVASPKYMNTRTALLQQTR